MKTSLLNTICVILAGIPTMCLFYTFPSPLGVGLGLSCFVVVLSILNKALRNPF